MCELLGMNCNVPTDICFSFKGFTERGGHTGTHEDGWGIAFYENKGCRIFLDTLAASISPVAALLQNFPIKSLNVIAHLRKANIGGITLENNQPFSRELWGMNWIFAHNGDLPEFKPTLQGRFLPVGDTDSELIFCFILEELWRRFPEGHPQPESLYPVLKELSINLHSYGIFNFLFSNGESLFAHCSTKLHYIIRKSPFKTAHLKDKDLSVDFSKVTTPNDRVAVIATQPLTDNEKWTAFATNELLLFHEGEIISC